MRRKQFAVLAALTCLLTAGCNQTPVTPEQSDDTGISAETRVPTSSSADANTVVDVEAVAQPIEEISLGKWDTKTDWATSDPVITFSGENVETEAAGVTCAAHVLTITKGGTYVLQGQWDEGRIVVNLSDKKEKIQLVLNGLSIHCSNGSPLTILNADKCILTLADGTENALSDGETYTQFDIVQEDGSSYPNACLASKDDLTINGSGSLTVNGSYRNGIQCSNDLKLVSGMVTVSAAGHGIKGNGSVQLCDGEWNVTAGEDGIKSETEDKEGKGYVQIAGGHVLVTAGQDGVDAATALYLTGGDVAIVAGGGAANGTPHAAEQFGGFGGNRRQGGFGMEQTAATTEEETVSSKGMKSGNGVLQMTGGRVQIDAADDALHSNEGVLVSGDAVVTLSSGDDGVHGDRYVMIGDAAAVTVTESYEGIEAAEITIAGGTVRVKASDDGFNASGGGTTNTATNDKTENNNRFGGFGGFGQDSGMLRLQGGYVYVDAGGDGIDSNGDIEMTGGTVVVCGPTDNGNGPLDCGDNQNKITVTGGTLMAVGSTGMMEAPEENYIGSSALNAGAGTLIVVTDESGTVLGALKTPKTAQGIVFSANGMADGYQVYTGGTYDGEWNADNFATGGQYTAGTLVTSGSGGVTGGFGSFGGFGGGHGGFGGMTPPDMSEGMTPSDIPDGFTPPDMPDGMTPPDMPDGMTPPDGSFGMKPNGGRGDHRPSEKDNSQT